MAVHRTAFWAMAFLVGILAVGADHAGRAQQRNSRPSNVMTQEDWDYFWKLPPARREAYMQARAERYQREAEEQHQRNVIENRKRALASIERTKREHERCLRLVLAVSDEQWQTLGPRLRRIGELKRQVTVAAGAPQFDANDVRIPFDEKLHGYERIGAVNSGAGTYTRWGRAGGGQIRGGASGHASGSAGRASGAATSGNRATGGTVGSPAFGGAGGGGAGGGGSGGGRTFTTPFAWRRLEPDNCEPTEGERLCEELFILLEDENADQELIRQKTEALQRLRAEARRELAQTQEELVPMLTPRQRARLILIGYLD